MIAADPEVYSIHGFACQGVISGYLFSSGKKNLDIYVVKCNILYIYFKFYF